MKPFRAISAAILALLVLVSSTSLAVGVHSCMDEVRNVALFSKASSCDNAQPPCHRHSTAECCDDQTVINQADDFKTSATDPYTTLHTPISAGEACVVLSEIIPEVSAAQFPSDTYDPPLRSFDLTVEHRVFLI